MKNISLLILSTLLCLAPGTIKHATAKSKQPRFIDQKNGIILDSRSGLEWAKEDSWAQLGKCLDWNQANAYVKELDLGGHKNWRLPTMGELADFPNGLIDRTKTESIGVDYKNWKTEYTINLNPIFGPKAAYWIWSSEEDGPNRAGMVDMRKGTMLSMEKSKCFVLGVRAVRKP